MGGTRSGGLKTAASNQAKDPDFYRRIGAMGGRVSTTGGFAANRELARKAGRIGGLISRRGDHKTTPDKASEYRAMLEDAKYRLGYLKDVSND